MNILIGWGWYLQISQRENNSLNEGKNKPPLMAATTVAAASSMASLRNVDHPLSSSKFRFGRIFPTSKHAPRFLAMAPQKKVLLYYLTILDFELWYLVQDVILTKHVLFNNPPRIGPKLLDYSECISYWGCYRFSVDSNVVISFQYFYLVMQICFNYDTVLVSTINNF